MDLKRKNEITVVRDAIRESFEIYDRIRSNMVQNSRLRKAVEAEEESKVGGSEKFSPIPG